MPAGGSRSIIRWVKLPSPDETDPGVKEAAKTLESVERERVAPERRVADHEGNNRQWGCFFWCFGDRPKKEEKPITRKEKLLALITIVIILPRTPRTTNALSFD